MKIKLFTHTDLDGVGCALLTNQCFEEVDIEFCDYPDIDSRVYQFLLSDNLKDYSDVYITDISVSEEIGKILNGKYESNIIKNLVLLDHHDTAFHLNIYDWCTVDIHLDGRKTSGTELFFYYLMKQGHEFNKATHDFVEIVNRWDSWAWFDKYNDTIPNKFNLLFKIYGKKIFLDIISDKIKLNNMSLTNGDIMLLEIEERRVDQYVSYKESSMIVKDILGYKAGVVYAENHISECGNRLANNHPELDFIALINMSAGVISYRGIKKNINLGVEIAKHFGGGGRIATAGSPISQDIIKATVDSIFH